MKFKSLPIKSLPFFDTHLHSLPHGQAMSNYTIESVRKCIETCGKIGIKIVCLTDHVPLPTAITDPTPEKDCGLKLNEFIDVLSKNRQQLKDLAKQNDLQLYIGGEFDFFADFQNYYDNFDKTFNPEFKVLGQHFIDTIEVYPDKNGLDCYDEKITKKKQKNFCFDYSETAFAFGVKQKGINVLIKRYFELLEEALSLQKYNSVAHLDLITKYNNGEKYFKEDKTYIQMVKRTLKSMKDKNVALEINLSATEIMKRLVPKEWIIKEALANNIPITFGSDVHGLNNVIINQQKINESLKKIGVQKIAVPGF